MLRQLCQMRPNPAAPGPLDCGTKVTRKDKGTLAQAQRAAMRAMAAVRLAAAPCSRSGAFSPMRLPTFRSAPQRMSLSARLTAVLGTTAPAVHYGLGPPPLT